MIEGKTQNRLKSGVSLHSNSEMMEMETVAKNKNKNKKKSRRKEPCNEKYEALTK